MPVTNCLIQTLRKRSEMSWLLLRTRGLNEAVVPLRDGTAEFSKSNAMSLLDYDLVDKDVGVFAAIQRLGAVARLAGSSIKIPPCKLAVVSTRYELRTVVACNLAEIEGELCSFHLQTSPNLRQQLL